jgi:hypothetical protein
MEQKPEQAHKKQGVSGNADRRSEPTRIAGDRFQAAPEGAVKP